jgi:hypothetical protein
MNAPYFCDDEKMMNMNKEKKVGRLLVYSPITYVQPVAVVRPSKGERLRFLATIGLLKRCGVRNGMVCGACGSV